MNFKSHPDPPRTLSVTHKAYVARVKSQPKESTQRLKHHRQHRTKDESREEDSTPQNLVRSKDNWTRREGKGASWEGNKNARGQDTYLNPSTLLLVLLWANHFTPHSPSLLNYLPKKIIRTTFPWERGLRRPT